MVDYSPEVIESLKQQRRFHEEQIRLIDLALSAIETGKIEGADATGQAGTDQSKVRKHRIPWTSEIEKLLGEYDEFNIIGLQKDLTEKRGISSAMTVQGRNVISNTLSRFIRRGRIEKIRPGVYRVVTESLSS